MLIVCLFLSMVQSASAFYQPSTGCWPNRDPLEESGGLNLYTVSENDPINNIDPSGESTVDIPAGKKGGVELTIQVVIDDTPPCTIVGINMLERAV